MFSVAKGEGSGRKVKEVRLEKIGGVSSCVLSFRIRNRHLIMHVMEV
jgi:hypothetical protein